MTTLTQNSMSTHKPSLPVLALCLSKAMMMSVKQRLQMARVFYLKP